MSQFEFTINGTTLKLTADDVAQLEAAMLDATKSPNRKVFRQGSTGDISARWLGGPQDDLKHFSRKNPPVSHTLTDC